MSETPEFRPTPVDELVNWLIAMDDPDSESGMEARRTVTLTNIIERARDTRRWIDLAMSTAPEALPYNPGAGPRLWEVDHPFYGADGYETTVGSFAELRSHVDSMDEDMNLVYRWDWDDYRQSHHDGLFIDGEFRDKQRLKVFWLMPRKSTFAAIECPVRHEEEAAVYEWLAGPRCLGHLRRLWEPLMGRVTEVDGE